MAVQDHQAAAVFAVCSALLFFFPLLAHGEEPSLEILPSGDTQTKPIGSSIIMTCKPKVEDTKLIKDMQWVNPQNRVIDPLNTFPGQLKPPMYTELHQDNTLSLYFNSLQEEQAGKYTCRGTYANSIYLNKSVTIDTIVAITWINAPENQHPILGEDFAIQCKVRARPSPLVDWLYNGELIKTNDRYVIDKNALTIKNVQKSDDGVYTCRASVLTTGELKERNIHVEVHVRPTLEEDHPTMVDIIEGEDASIQCKARGKPQPSVTWVKSLTQQNLSDADRFGVNPNTGVLTITNVNREDSGKYQCTATNAVGTATMNITVNVIVKPKIIEFLNSTVVEDKEANIVCKAFGRPPPEITFRKLTSQKAYEKGAQPDDDRIILTNSQDETTWETVGTLTIHESMRSNDGLYECIAQNAGGEDRKNGHLIVEFPPSFASMTTKTVWSWEQRPVNISCIAESIPNATIRWTSHGDQKIDDAMIKQVGNGPLSTLMIVPLDRRYYTTYKCIASNPHGTREHTIELREATKPGDVQQSKMIEITATTIRFELTLPATHPELPIRTITVQYKKDSQSWSEARNQTWSVEPPYIVEGLTPQTSYEFRFAAQNEVGLGNWGAFYHEVTPTRTFPNQPKIISPKTDYDLSAFNNQYELSWLVPADNGEPIDMYEIKFCQIMRVAGEWEVSESTCRTEDVKTQGRTRHWLKDLVSDTFYKVELRAHNKIGFSQPGTSKFKTARESTGLNVDYNIITSAGGTPKLAVTAIATAITIIFVAI